jgi:rubrerythrin
MFTWDEIIDVALGIEQAGEEIYRQAAEAITDPAMSEALTWLADDEARHHKWFTRLRNQQPVAAPTTKIEKLSRTLMRDMAENQAQFISSEKLMKAGDFRELLTTALEAEKETARFYELIGLMLESTDDQEIIEKIITEEYRHAAILEQWLKEGHPPDISSELKLQAV